MKENDDTWLIVAIPVFAWLIVAIGVFAIVGCNKSSPLEDINPKLLELPNDVQKDIIIALETGAPIAKYNTTPPDNPLKEYRRMSVDSTCQCNADPFMYWERVGTTNRYYANTETILDIIWRLDAPSPNMYDLNEDGICNTEDFLLILGAYGNEPPEAECYPISFVASSGWQLNFSPPSFLHPSGLDEASGLPSTLDCPLNTFWINEYSPDLDIEVVQYFHK